MVEDSESWLKDGKSRLKDCHLQHDVLFLSLRIWRQAEHGVVQVGPQWHQDGSTEKAVFSRLGPT